MVVLKVPVAFTSRNIAGGRGNIYTFLPYILLIHILYNMQYVYIAYSIALFNSYPTIIQSFRNYWGGDTPLLVSATALAIISESF
jgi:hypothetical protein